MCLFLTMVEPSESGQVDYISIQLHKIRVTMAVFSQNYDLNYAWKYSDGALPSKADSFRQMVRWMTNDPILLINNALVKYY